ncbi:hypothetical protein [Nocardioides sp. zg-1230]|uniref:hypothetical protein n=1 Tax=Nocardioides sp. zg-1230 TaxID=2736601 RepID=UPI001554D4C9|nr:hypothetical protein [Nocardioides sp. zg-1230]NPC43339.1 hypothetical protein [Nocardioides sp. zg-1230]NPC44757.1 hypothetical protein [Nocardioides sp. zg-1230]
MGGPWTRVVAGLAVGLACATSCAERPVETEASIGQVERTESMDALGMALVTNGQGAARLVGTLVNQADDPDRLIGVDVEPTVGSFDVVIADGPIVLPPEEPVTLARDAQMTVFTDRFVPGFRPELRLVFLNSAPIVTTVPVETQTGPYAEVEVLRAPDGDISPD